MIDRLTMQYNRGRQAAITNELVDIITGTLSFVLSVTHLLTMNVQVPVHCKQVPWLSNTHQVITPVYIDSETNSDFFALKLHVCDQCKMHNKYGRVHKGILMNRFVRELTNPSVSRHFRLGAHCCRQTDYGHPLRFTSVCGYSAADLWFQASSCLRVLQLVTCIAMVLQEITARQENMIVLHSQSNGYNREETQQCQ
jgi:hypothetical protein